MNKKTIFKIGVSLIGLVSITVFFVVLKNNGNINALNVKGTESVITKRQSRAVWASNATTVEELILESDIVVRVRAIESPATRVVSIEAPTVDENGDVIGSTVIRVLFSDTEFEVVNIYMGSAPSQISVMQTGGYDPSVSRSIEETIDDPLYNVGEEYILFLRSIAGDHVHAPDRDLYLTINPFGRYRIEGKHAFSYGQDNRPGVLTVKELEAHIMSVLHHNSLTVTETPQP